MKKPLKEIISGSLLCCITFFGFFATAVSAQTPGFSIVGEPSIEAISETNTLSSTSLESVIESPILYPAMESDVLQTSEPLPFYSEAAATGDISMEEFCESCGDEELQQVVVKKSIFGFLETIDVLPQDEVWLVSARDYLAGETDLSRLCVCRLEHNELVPSTLRNLVQAHSGDDDKSTVLYVHGNQTDMEFAIARGLQVYRNALATKAQLRAPVRYVIWAWKSEQERIRYFPDYLIKSKRSVTVGETFASTLNEFSDRNMVLFGYSLGAQVVLSALDSKILRHRAAEPPQYQLAFAAPAINGDYVASHGLSQMENLVAQTFVFVNRKDRATRAARAIVRCQAATRNATLVQLSQAGKLNLGSVTSTDVYEETGRLHSIERYTRSDTLQLKIASLVNEVAAQKGSIPLSSGPTLAAPTNATPLPAVVGE